MKKLLFIIVIFIINSIAFSQENVVKPDSINTYNYSNDAFNMNIKVFNHYNVFSDSLLINFQLKQRYIKDNHRKMYYSGYNDGMNLAREELWLWSVSGLMFGVCLTLIIMN